MRTRTLNVDRSTATAHRLSHYDGVCGNLHGHNIQWEIKMVVSMEDVGEGNMPIDFKTVSDIVDSVDHAILLKNDDPLVEELGVLEPREEQDVYHITDSEVLGDAWIFTAEDPTCEYMVEWMAENLYDSNERIEYVAVTAAETDKYHMTGEYSG